MVITLDPGFYTNLFEVHVPNDNNIPIMIVERSNYPDLRTLREEIKNKGWDVLVYAPVRSKILYGFGKDMQLLSSKGFRQDKINLLDEPHLTAKMIFEAFIKKSQELNFFPFFSKDKGRCRLFNQNEVRTTSDRKVKLYPGYDVRVIFLKDQIENNLVFALIVDVTYTLKDFNDKPLNFRDIVTKFGKSTLKEIRQLQNDLIPTGINKEVSRQRLLEDIVPFVEKFSEIDLPCGGLKGQITPSPTRIILGEEDETIR